MNNTVYNLIQNKVSVWIREEKQNSQSVVNALLKHISKTPLRVPQREAIEVYLWLKFVGQNQKLSEIVKKGLLYDEEQAKGYKYFQILGQNYGLQFLNQFAQDNDLKKMQERIANDPQGTKTDWNKVLVELLHNYEYPNFLFSLPMGAGKTYLMAAFIYLDLYLASLFKKDKRFAHNFVVFAPSASKTAILPSLQTIRNFDPAWVLPKNEANRIKQEIQIEILDSLSSQRKDKLQGNNPNLEKVNRLTQTKDFGLVFITNAEKVVLEKYQEDLSKTLFANSKEALEAEKFNELREKLSEISHLGIMLDEVHHSYGKSEDEDKKLRLAVNILNQHGNIVSVLGFSGTPYVAHNIMIGDDKIKLNQIQDIVYNYVLSDGIGNFLKIPDVKKSPDVKEDIFIKEALTEFFDKYDKVYANGTHSKIAFYCPSIKTLNEKILPAVQDWYKKNRKGKEVEIFRYYSDVKKEDKKYQLPKENLAIFNNLDKPYSDKRIVLLVAVGTEGWDCKSLTAVALPRLKTTKNFVLQTACRCLREVENASQEKALIFLNKDNYQTLDKELKENYHLSISDLKFTQNDTITVSIPKPKLGKIKYKQIQYQYTLITQQAKDFKKELADFDFSKIKKIYNYDTSIIKAKIGKQGIEKGLVSEYQGTKSTLNYEFSDFIYDLARAAYGKYSEVELLLSWELELKKIFSQIQKEADWIYANPNLDYKKVAQFLAGILMQEVSFNKQVIKKDIEIELLEWSIKDPQMGLKTSANGSYYKFIPEIDNSTIKTYLRHPEDLAADAQNLDSQDISFNYVPYRMDSDFERNALREMLSYSELGGVEVYYNGFKDLKLDNFWIQTPYGVYTPDFLVIKRQQGKKYKNKTNPAPIEKILIIETKGGTYYNNEFIAKEKFVENEFLKHNPNFKYRCFIDEDGKNDFNKHREELLKTIKTL